MSTAPARGCTGTGAAALVSGQNYPYGVAVDSSHIYWTYENGGTITEASLDGTNPTTIASGQGFPAGMAVGPQ